MYNITKTTELIRFICNNLFDQTFFPLADISISNEVLIDLKKQVDEAIEDRIGNSEY